MRKFFLLQFILLACGPSDRTESERILLEAELKAKKQAVKREYEKRLAQIPPFVDLGDTLNFTDKNGWKQGIWEFRAEGLDKFNITPMGETQALQLDGKVQEIRQYYNDTLHGIFKSYDIFNDSRLCIEGTYILGKKDGRWEYPCLHKDSIFDSVFDVE